MKSIFSVSRRATFKDCDPAGIVFFARFFDFAHDTLEEFARSKDIWKDWFDSKEVAAPIVNCTATYKSPLRLGEEFEVQILSAEVGNSSVKVRLVVTTVDQKNFAELESTHVFINKGIGQAVAVPKKIELALNLKS